MVRIFCRLTIFKSAKILTEHKYDTSDSSSETSSDSNALDFDLEVDGWRALLANFITEIHAYADELLAEDERLKKLRKQRGRKQEIRERPSRKT